MILQTNKCKVDENSLHTERAYTLVCPVKIGMGRYNKPKLQPVYIVSERFRRGGEVMVQLLPICPLTAKRLTRYRVCVMSLTQYENVLSNVDYSRYDYGVAEFDALIACFGVRRYVNKKWQNLSK